ncbi:proton-coupled zinc antiporter SLC30A1-like [Babylonia areolata]|uniref:proton-coupled zinc antiporter SLC30A1-like n=1 Tax=Babylonia areolata TaxID=304850 RepID=UPI003FD67F1A
MGQCCSETCRLGTMIAMTFSFFLLEIVVGHLTNSVALVADSFHMLSDIVALIVGLIAIRISKWPSRKNTFGWARAEVLGALVNAVFLIALCFSILTESIKRLFMLEHIERPILLLAVGVGGLLVNLIGLGLFHKHAHGHSHGVLKHPGDTEKRMEEWVVQSEGREGVDPIHRPSFTIEYDVDSSASARAKVHSSQQLNMKAVFLHVLGDALGSVVVIISSLTIWLAEGRWRFYLDPAMSFVMVLVILITTIPLLKQTSLILLQTAPDFLDQDKLKLKLKKVEGVMGVHEFHVWQLTEKRVVLSAHIVCNDLSDYMKVAHLVKDLFHREGVHSTTIQPEFVALPATKEELEECSLTCAKACEPDTCCGQRPGNSGRKNRRAPKVAFARYDAPPNNGDTPSDSIASSLEAVTAATTGPTGSSSQLGSLLYCGGGGGEIPLIYIPLYQSCWPGHT